MSKEIRHKATVNKTNSHTLVNSSSDVDSKAFDGVHGATLINGMIKLELYDQMSIDPDKGEIRKITGVISLPYVQFLEFCVSTLGMLSQQQDALIAIEEDRLRKLKALLIVASSTNQ